MKRKELMKEMLKAIIHSSIGIISYIIFKHILEQKNKKSDDFNDEHFEYNSDEY